MWLAESIPASARKLRGLGELRAEHAAQAFLSPQSGPPRIDEATGALDPASEGRVFAGYDALMRGRTTVLITHRPELAKRADRAVVIRDGHIVQDGPPAELSARIGPYRALFAVESG